MLNYTPLYTHIWSDKKFKSLSRDGKLLFFYLIANEAITLTGIYELDLEICRIKVNLNNNFDNAFKEIKERKMIEWDTENEIIWVVNRFKLMPNNNSPQVIRGTLKELNLMKHPFKDKFIEKYKNMNLFKSGLNTYNKALEEKIVPKEVILTEEFILDSLKFYTTKFKLKEFLWRLNPALAEADMDNMINKVNPNLK